MLYTVIQDGENIACITIILFWPLMNTAVAGVSLEDTLRSIFILLRDDACRKQAIESIAQSAWHWLFVICVLLFEEPKFL